MAWERLTDGSGRHFDSAKAECFEEDREHDGKNFISKATGSQWEHEKLYRTKGGLWIKHSWSQWQGSRPTYQLVDAQEAARWLACNAEWDALTKYFPDEEKKLELQ